MPEEGEYSENQILRGESTSVKIERWDDGHGIRLPDAVIGTLGIREGDEVTLHPIGWRTFEIRKAPKVG